MKNLTLKSFITGAAIAIVSLSAQADSSFNFTVQGSIAVVCEATNNSIASTETIDLTSTSAQTLGSITYTCNNAGGFTRSISSENSGQLVNGAQGIDYEVSHGGGSGLSFDATQLTSAETDTLSGSSAFASGQTGSLSVTVPSLPGGLLAGTYADVVTVAVTAN